MNTTKTTDFGIALDENSIGVIVDVYGVSRQYLTTSLEEGKGYYLVGASITISHSTLFGDYTVIIPDPYNPVFKVIKK